MSARRLWIDTQGQPVITTTPNGVKNATRWGWTEAKAVPAEAVVVEGPLPEVDPERPGFSGYVGLDGPGSAITEPQGLLADPEMHREKARRELALAAYLERYPWGPDWTRPNVPAAEVR